MVNSVDSRANERARETRRAQLTRMTKAELVRKVRKRLLGSAHPPERWRKDELVQFILDGEFRSAG